MGGYIGARAGSLTTTVANVQDVTATDTTPEVTIINNTHEDTDGGREGKVIFKGQQSGGEESTLAEIQASHDGTADDEKGDLIFRTNDGNDGASPTERLRLDSVGSLGLGTSIPASSSTGVYLTGGGATYSTGSTYRYDMVNAYFDTSASAWKYIGNGVATQIYQANGDFVFNNAVNNTSGAGASLSWVEAMRIKETAAHGAGLGIGTTAPLRQLHISNTSANSEIAFTAATNGVSSILFGDGLTGTDIYKGYIQYNHADDALLLAAASGVVARIAGTALYVNTTLAFGGALNVHEGGVGVGESSNAGYYRRMYWNAANNEMRFWNGTNEARITDGGVFTNASDISLKKDIADIEYGIDTVKSLQPRKYKMKSDNKEQVGFIAQEMESHVPEIVSVGVTPDGDEHKGISYGQLTAVLTKALQEAIAKIETLETKVAALEAE